MAVYRNYVLTGLFLKSCLFLVRTFLLAAGPKRSKSGVSVGARRRNFIASLLENFERLLQDEQR